MKSDHYLDRCLAEAALSPLRFRHGAVVVKGGKVLGAGHNDYLPGPRPGALSRHAEAAAIEAALGRGAWRAGGGGGGGGTERTRLRCTVAVRAYALATLSVADVERCASLCCGGGDAAPASGCGCRFEGPALAGSHDRPACGKGNGDGSRWQCVGGQAWWWREVWEAEGEGEEGEWEGGEE